VPAAKDCKKTCDPLRHVGPVVAGYDSSLAPVANTPGEKLIRSSAVLGLDKVFLE
jgi:hypothetical protein